MHSAIPVLLGLGSVLISACATGTSQDGTTRAVPSGFNPPSALLRCTGELSEFTRLDACFHVMEEGGVPAPQTLMTHRHYTVGSGRQIEATIPAIDGEFLAVIVAGAAAPSPEFYVEGARIDNGRQSFFEFTELSGSPCPLRMAYIVGVDRTFTINVRFPVADTPRSFVVEDVSEDCR